MICVHCAHDNPEGRKYCRNCAKPLASEIAGESVIGARPAATAAAAPPKPTLNKLALASLVTGFLALLPPFGLAAVVLGHLSRGQVAKSGGRQQGKTMAFAGLILGYGQLAIFAVLLLGFFGLMQDIRGDLAKHPDTRAALLDRLAHGDPNKVTPEKSARQEATAVQALHLIQAKETQYLAEHPEEGYACQMYQVGWDPGADTELDALLRESHYDTKFIRCGSIPATASTPATGPMYVMLSIPRSEGNGAESPVFCLDSTNGIERYSSAQSGDAIAAIMTSRTDPCPLTGTHVD